MVNRKILIILLLIISTFCSGQYVVKQNGLYVFQYGDLVKAQVVQVPTPTITIVSATVENANPDRFVVTFSDNIDGVSPNVSEWTLTINGSPDPCDNYSINYDEVWFYSGAYEAAEGDVITISYSGDSWISYPDYYLVQDYANYSVTNNVISSSFTILHEWDFEEPDVWLGVFNADSLDGYFNMYTTADWADGDSIVLDTINGVQTQVLQIHNTTAAFDRGLQARMYFDALETGYDSVCASWNMKFGTWRYAFDSPGSAGKTPSMSGLPDDNISYLVWPMDPTQSFIEGNLFKAGGRATDYHYNRSDPDGYHNPWTEDSYASGFQLEDSTYFANDTWYNVTQCITINTIGEADGISETWIDGRMIYQFDWLEFVEDVDLDVNSFRLRNFYSAVAPTHDSYFLFDNLTIWMPVGDTYFDNGTTHPIGATFSTPVSITDKSFGYDHFIDSEITITTLGYGSALDENSDETWLIDAGAGNTVSIDFTAGVSANGDFIFVYNGKDSNSGIIEWVKGSAPDISTSFGGDGVVNSTGRYMFVRIVTGYDNWYAKFTADITFN